MLDLFILLSVYPSTKGPEYIIAIAFLVIFIIVLGLFFKSDDEKINQFINFVSVMSQFGITLTLFVETIFRIKR